MWDGRGRCSLVNDPLRITVWWLFLQIQFFKVGAKIFSGIITRTKKTRKSFQPFSLPELNVIGQRWMLIEQLCISFGLVVFSSWDTWFFQVLSSWLLSPCLGSVWLKKSFWEGKKAILAISFYERKKNFINLVLGGKTSKFDFFWITYHMKEEDATWWVTSLASLSDDYFSRYCFWSWREKSDFPQDKPNTSIPLKALQTKNFLYFHDKSENREGFLFPKSHFTSKEILLIFCWENFGLVSKKLFSSNTFRLHVVWSSKALKSQYFKFQFSIIWSFKILLDPKILKHVPDIVCSLVKTLNFWKIPNTTNLLSLGREEYIEIDSLTFRSIWLLVFKILSCLWDLVDHSYFFQ